MELASQEMIATLLREAARTAPVRVPRGSGMDYAQPGRRAERRRVRCRCGQCRQCLDDARWNRIFAEKFADPEYYTRRQVRCASPLESL